MLTTLSVCGTATKQCRDGLQNTKSLVDITTLFSVLPRLRDDIRRFSFCLEMLRAATDGTVTWDSDIQDSKFLVQHSCDGVAAPVFPPFGSET